MSVSSQSRTQLAGLHTFDEVTDINNNTGRLVTIEVGLKCTSHSSGIRAYYTSHH